MINPFAIIAATLFFAQIPNPTPDPTSVIKPGQVWNDTSGKPIQSHLGGVLFDQGVYYWYGMNFDGLTIAPKAIPDVDYSWSPNLGVTIYKSKDLIHWEHAGTVLADVSFDPGNLLQPLNVLCRPKVIRNEVTHKYIMMAALTTPDIYSVNDVVVAVSDSPIGPFKLQGKLGWKGPPNQTGLWQHVLKNETAKDEPTRIRGFDTTLYKDDDGKAYLLTAHRDIVIYALSDDYLSVVKVRQMEGAAGEAPAVFKAAGTYFLVTSNLSGYAPNQNTYFTASSIWGPWTPRGPFAKGPGSGDTFGSQVTFVLPVADKPDAFIFMADNFHSISSREVPDLSKTTHVWLPIELDLKNLSMQVQWKDEWDLSVFNGR
jgi:glycosyl hydrolase family 43